MHKIVAFFILATLCLPTQAEHITIYVGNEPFLSYQDQKSGEVKGLAIDTINLLLAEVGHKASIEVTPFARIEKNRQKSKNQMFIMFYKKEQSLDEFHHIGSITAFPMNLYKLKNRKDITINSVEDLDKYSFGVVRGGGRYRYFNKKKLNKSFEPHIVTTDKQNILRFFVGRYDILVENSIVLKYFTRSENINLDLVEKIMPIEELSGEMGLFFSKSTDHVLVLKYKTALEKIQKTDKYKQLLRYYGTNL